MTRTEFETRRVEADIETTEASLSGAMVWMKRMTTELADALSDRRDHCCQTTNLTTAVADVARLGEKLAGLRSTLKILTEIKNA